MELLLTERDAAQPDELCIQGNQQPTKPFLSPRSGLVARVIRVRKAHELPRDRIAVRCLATGANTPCRACPVASIERVTPRSLGPCGPSTYVQRQIPSTRQDCARPQLSGRQHAKAPHSPLPLPSASRESGTSAAMKNCAEAGIVTHGKRTKRSSTACWTTRRGQTLLGHAATNPVALLTGIKCHRGFATPTRLAIWHAPHQRARGHHREERKHRGTGHERPKGRWRRVSRVPRERARKDPDVP